MLSGNQPPPVTDLWDVSELTHPWRWSRGQQLGGGPEEGEKGWHGVPVMAGCLVPQTNPCAPPPIKEAPPVLGPSCTQTSGSSLWVPSPVIHQ